MAVPAGLLCGKGKGARNRSGRKSWTCLDASLSTVRALATMGELSVIPVQATASHPAPQLQQVDRKLRSEYSRPRDGNVESNLLILLHGLGESDSHTHARLAR